MPTLLRETTPTARKAHTCCACYIRIEPGTKYRRSVYLGDDGLYEWVCCVACDPLVNVVWQWAGSPWEGITDEEYVEWAQQSTDDPRAVAFLKRRGLETGSAAEDFLLWIGCLLAASLFIVVLAVGR